MIYTADVYAMRHQTLSTDKLRTVQPEIATLKVSYRHSISKQSLLAHPIAMCCYIRLLRDSLLRICVQYRTPPRVGTVRLPVSHDGA